MAILVIGNGFDLAHGLRTKYSHFLDFVKMFREYEDYVKGEKSPRDKNEAELFEFVRSIYIGNNNHSVYNELAEYIGNNTHNILLTHFLKVYEKRCSEEKDGWIDFECELADIVSTFNSAREYMRAQKGNPSLLPHELAVSLRSFFLANSEQSLTGVSNFERLSAEQIENFSEEITYEELKKITRILEIYLAEYIETREVDKRIKQIADLKIDKVISFNYTNTFQRLYDLQNKAEYCYIHGRLNRYSNLETCNLVLGIDEFSTEEKADSDNTFVWFKKFYQRIYKETDSTYIDWLNDYNTSSFKGPLEIYFYGHSLASTDKDVLKSLIDNPITKIHIFYPDKKEMAKQIKNLILIIGKASLIHMTRGINRKIEFIQIDSGETNDNNY